MNKKMIGQYFQLAKLIRDFKEEDLKNPQNQAILAGYMALEQEYAKLFDAVNNPEKMSALTMIYSLEEDLQMLGSVFDDYYKKVQDPIVRPQDLQECFKRVVESLRSSLESKTQSSTGKNTENLG